MRFDAAAEDVPSRLETDAAVLRTRDRRRGELSVLIARTTGSRVAHKDDPGGVVGRARQIHIVAVVLVLVGEIVPAVRLIVRPDRRLVRGAGGEDA